jgi:hypothetical protein
VNTRKKIGFCTMISLLGLTELPTFKALLEQLRHHHHLIPPKDGREDAHLYLELTLLNLKFSSFIFIHLILPTQSIKNVETWMPR